MAMGSRGPGGVKSLMPGSVATKVSPGRNRKMKKIGLLVVMLLVTCLAGCQDKKAPSSESPTKDSPPGGKATVGQFSLSPGQKVDVSIKADSKTWVGLDVEEFGIECALNDKNSSLSLVTNNGRKAFMPVDGSIKLILTNKGHTASKVVLYTEPYTEKD